MAGSAEISDSSGSKFPAKLRPRLDLEADRPILARPSHHPDSSRWGMPRGGPRSAEHRLNGPSINTNFRERRLWVPTASVYETDLGSNSEISSAPNVDQGVTPIVSGEDLRIIRILAAFAVAPEKPTPNTISTATRCGHSSVTAGQSNAFVAGSA